MNMLSARSVWEHPRDAIYFGWSVRCLKVFRRFKAGEYLLKPGMKYVALLNAFAKGQYFLRKMTFIEGQRFEDMRRILLMDKHLHHTLVNETDTSLRLLLLGWQTPPLGWPSNIVSFEGLFFPDTYRYYHGESDWVILRMAYRKMLQLLADVWEHRLPGLPYQTPYELLTMASLVEAEAHLPYERARIAGVFIRRLEHHMRLQCDPTVSYGLGYDFHHRLTKQDLQTITPYNTYALLGLPPTPILMPGLAAMQAAAHPLLGEDLYFVARGDGSHVFSKTLQEHNGAVNQYIRKK
jgi:UPF0755 protein